MQNNSNDVYIISKFDLHDATLYQSTSRLFIADPKYLV